MRDYYAFLAAKMLTASHSGFNVASDAISPKLFKFQADVVRRALEAGKYALMEERGLGKTIQEFEWARHVVAHTHGKVLILAPLAVAYQMVDEAAKFDYDVRYCQSRADIGDATTVITNYERLNYFEPGAFSGVVLDESSILKAFTGATKRALIEAFKRTPYKLAASATPAPNDHLELGNHAEFLDVMRSDEMIARWFINDTMQAGNYRLKRHAESDFWRWLTSWAVCLSKPSDLGSEYDMPDFELPPLHLHEHLVKTSEATISRTFSEGRLLPDSNPSSTTLFKVKRESLDLRIAKALEIVSALPEGEPVVLWCDTNDEADALKAAFPEALEVRGSHSAKRKASALKAFTVGEARQIITKPDIAGMGLNWQHCAHAVFIGVSYSFEKFYQAIGRNHRYGQERAVHAHLIYASAEGNVLTTLRHKQAQFAEMQMKMNAAMQEHGLFRDGNRYTHRTSIGQQAIIVPDWLTSKGAA